MREVILSLIFLGLINQSIHGLSCGIKHCMKCSHGQCVECQYGWYGVTCSEKCQAGCWLGGCEQSTGICIQCTPGYYRQSCDSECPRHCRVSYDKHRNCLRKDGYCLEGCAASYWGPHCKENCSINCVDRVCEQKDGTCLKGCNSGFFGKNCNKICPEKCFRKDCSYIRGECKHGCDDGFHGHMCNITCTNCVNNECTYNRLTKVAECTNGCQDGWTSDDCKQRCNSQCKNRKCDRNGNCQSCLDGYFGDACNRNCEQNHCQVCDRETGMCTATIAETDDSTYVEQLLDKSDDDSSGTSPSISLVCWTCLVIILATEWCLGFEN